MQMLTAILLEGILSNTYQAVDSFRELFNDSTRGEFMVALSKSVFSHDLHPLGDFVQSKWQVFECLAYQLIGQGSCRAARSDPREYYKTYGKLMLQLGTIVYEKLLYELKEDFAKENSSLNREIRKLGATDMELVQQKLQLLAEQVRLLEKDFYEGLNTLDPHNLGIVKLEEDVFKLKDPTVQAVGLVQGALNSVAAELIRQF